MLLMMLLACGDPCEPQGGIDYIEDTACLAPSNSHDSPPPTNQPDPCDGLGFDRQGVLEQLCISCGSVLCSYSVRSSEVLGGVEMEIKAPIADDPEWIEYHDAFLDIEGPDTQPRKELVLELTDNADLWLSNENTLFNLDDESIAANVTLELSVMLPDGTYPECIIFGNDPSRFIDDCILIGF